MEILIPIKVDDTSVLPVDGETYFVICNHRASEEPYQRVALFKNNGWYISEFTFLPNVIAWMAPHKLTLKAEEHFHRTVSHLPQDIERINGNPLEIFSYALELWDTLYPITFGADPMPYVNTIAASAGVYLTLRERMNHLISLNISVDDDIKHHPKGELLQGAVALIKNDVELMPHSFDAAYRIKMFKRDPVERLSIALGLIVAHLDVLLEIEHRAKAKILARIGF